MQSLNVSPLRVFVHCLEERFKRSVTFPAFKHAERRLCRNPESEPTPLYLPFCLIGIRYSSEPDSCLDIQNKLCKATIRLRLWTELFVYLKLVSCIFEAGQWTIRG